MTDYASARPKDVRALIRAGQITAPTTGMCDGYAQGNLVVLPMELAWDFLLFCQRNPIVFSCRTFHALVGCRVVSVCRQYIQYYAYRAIG